MREAVQQLVACGRLPDAASVSTEDLDWYEDRIDSLESPLTNEEAVALYTIVGDDTFYGLAWSLIHRIESAPDWPIWTCFDQIETQTQHILYMSAQNWLQSQLERDSSA